MILAHPAALWCLLGLPLVVAVHFLQRRSRRQVVTTLFLLQQMRRESEVGNRLERLRSSIPLWLQLFMVCVLTWLLAKPQWLQQDAVQRIAIVMDSSASMSAFRAEAEAALRETLSTVLSPSARMELTLLSSDIREPTLYHGASLAELQAACSRWQPQLGVHDFTPALRSARSLSGAQGSVLLITDHASSQALPYEAVLLSVGSPKTNVGWAGMTVEEKNGQLFWRALVRNFSASAQQCEWSVRSEGRASAPKEITLTPQETRTLTGPFPTSEALTLQLRADDFPLDDELPIQRPRPKLLALHVAAPLMPDGTSELCELLEKFADTRLVGSAAESDVRGLIWPPGTALESGQNAVIFASPTKGGQAPWLQGSIVAEAHPLVEGLNWQSLQVSEGMIMPREEQDRVLVWQGQRPLISLRRTPADCQQLFCHFDLLNSNARRLPALAVLLHRFLQSIRQEKLAPEAANFELRQRLTVAHQRGEKAPPLTMTLSDPPGTAQSWPAFQAHLLRAPSRPGFFKVRQHDRLLLLGAAHFADAREADLSQAKPFRDLSQLRLAQAEATLAPDSNSTLWLLLLLAALLSSWWWSNSARNSGTPATPSSPAPLSR